MAKLRIYYNETRAIVGVEHRPDEQYTAENVTQKGTAWIVVEERDGKAEPWETLVVAGKEVGGLETNEMHIVKRNEPVRPE